MTTQPSDWAVASPEQWRELCRRLYIELYHCDQQMTSGKRPKWKTGATVFAVLADAKDALEASRAPVARELDASGTTNSAQISSSLVVGDTERLDWIERTYSGMTNRERYLPVQMIWGKGANGRTLREAIDKYMRKEAAMGAVGAGN